MSTAVAEKFHGELLDADGHVYMEPDDLRDFAREIGGALGQDFYKRQVETPEFADAIATNRSELWSTKGLCALGAYDPADRKEALELMGVKAQLVFPNTGSGELRIDSDAARRACRVYNDFAIDWTRKAGGRARAVAQINMSNADWAIAELDRVLKAGALGVTLPCHRPPAGVSPAHSLWDPFWARLQEANVPATLHLGAAGLLSCRNPGDEMFPEFGWGDSETLRRKPAERGGGEEAISPYFMLVAHVGPEVFLQTMVMGKVFERFPRLRFGIIEASAEWVGAAAERMDAWTDFMAKVGVTYEMKPSEFLKRNVRVTPFWHEDLPRIIDRYGLEDVWVFSTDYPHLEGSRDPIGKFSKHLNKLPAGYDQRFFIDNNRLLFPDT
jgi:predicted TIM-barrel fold metal-dependent hydrolase